MWFVRAEGLNNKGARRKLLHVGACPGSEASDAGWRPRNGRHPTMAVKAASGDAEGNTGFPADLPGGEAGLTSVASQAKEGIHQKAGQYATTVPTVSGKSCSKEG